MLAQAEQVQIEKAGSRAGMVWKIFGGALLVRLLILPLNHPWDAQTWYNLLVDLNQHHSPYDTFEQLSLFAGWKSRDPCMRSRPAPAIVFSLGICP